MQKKWHKRPSGKNQTTLPNLNGKNNSLQKISIFNDPSNHPVKYHYTIKLKKKLKGKETHFSLFFWYQVSTEY